MADFSWFAGTDSAFSGLASSRKNGVLGRRVAACDCAGLAVNRQLTHTISEIRPSCRIVAYAFTWFPSCAQLWNSLLSAAAHTYWPNQNPLGKRVRLHLDTRGLVSSAKPPWTTIIGVIADARTESLADAAIPQIYRSVYQRPAKDLAIFLRGQLDPSGLSAQVREQVQAVDATLPVFHAETLDDVLATSLSVRRFSMEMVAFFAATALLLAGLGIYGTISYVVNEQRREIAIRLALGAQRGTILKMVLRRGLGLVAAGAGLGVAGALIVSHLMAGLLYGVSPTDLPTFAGVTLVLTTVALAASYIPALRAMRLDPTSALHSE